MRGVTTHMQVEARAFPFLRIFPLQVLSCWEVQVVMWEMADS